MTIFDVLLMIGVMVLVFRYIITCEKLTLKTHLYLALGLALTEAYAIYLFCERKSLTLVYANSVMFIAVVAISVVIIVMKLKQAELAKDKQAYFITKWDDGSVVITPCNIDSKTKEITDIMQYDCNIRGNLCSEAVLVYGNEYSVKTVEKPCCKRFADMGDELLFSYDGGL